MEGTLKDCGWCDLPMDVLQVWDLKIPGKVNPATLQVEGRTIVRMAVAMCIAGHRYAGPLEDLYYV